MQVDRLSTVWLTTVPDTVGKFTGPVFAEIAARYFLLPSPTLRPFVGMRIYSAQARTADVCDAYGDALCNANLGGGGWNRVHNEGAKDPLLLLLRKHGLRAKDEVLELFMPAVPVQHRGSMESSHREQGYVPDLITHLPNADGALVGTLLEVKTINLNTTWYRPIGREANVARAVEGRARAVQKEAEAKLHRKDRRWCGTAAGETGPLQATLQAYGRLRGLAFGHIGEASKEVHDLLGAMAAAASLDVARSLGLRSAKQATARMLWQARRVLGCAHWRARANLLIGRQCRIGVDGGRSGARHGNSAAAPGGETATATARAAAQAGRRDGAARGGRGAGS